jgi:transposase
MEHAAIDLHCRSSILCVAQSEGGYQEQSFVTDRPTLLTLLKARPRMRVLLESSTSSEWAARVIEQAGHEVVVADPNFELMYATRARRIKTDLRDARALCDACRLGNYRLAHRSVEPWQSIRRRLSVREALVGSRTKMINLARALLRQEGMVMGSGAAEDFAKRLKKMQLPAELAELVHPLNRSIRLLSGRIDRLDRQLEVTARSQPRVVRLMSVPGVGPVTALAFAAVVEPAERFAGGEQVSCYLGLVPCEDSSSERRRLGRITKTGDSRVRWLLVEAGWRLLRSKGEEAGALRRWGLKLAARRGKSKAAVALARRLAVILWAMDRHQRNYQAERVGKKRRTPAMQT